MAHRSIEETFRTIRPKGIGVFPADQQISTGITGVNGGAGGGLSAAGQQIAQLQSAHQQQAALIQANTAALQNNTSAQSGRTAGNVASSVASHLPGGGLGLLSPLISGIASLFGGHAATPAPLAVYTPPPPVTISANLRGTGFDNAGAGAGPGTGNPTGTAQQVSAGPQITVNVNAMDSQSFMDRSSDIASAVREAMLNLHPINAVVAEL